ncbi:MAG: hypothetical protein WA862_10240 [Solirubrobacterales bacterium]
MTPLELAESKAAEVAGGTLRQKGVPGPVVTQLESNYSQSQVDALKIAMGGASP